MELALVQIQNYLDTLLSETPEYFCVNLKIKPTNNIKIFLDGDMGITIEKCVQINRKLYRFIEENGFYAEGDFSLEISSPGVDEPLKLARQYQKNIGRFLEITFNDESKKEGQLIDVTETDIILEIDKGKGKKAVTEQLTFSLETIQKAIVQVRF